MPDLATVMIVDDDIIMRMMLEESLGNHYSVVAVSNGEECIAACAAQHPDIVLLDVEMPGINGYETCRRLKASDKPNMLVVFISSHDRLEDRLQGYDAGGEDYILKPIEPAELLTKITLLLKARKKQGELKQAAEYASHTAMTAMSSLGEAGVLLRSLQHFNTCKSLDDLAKAVTTAMSDFSLNGVVRLRARQEVIMRSTHGSVSPIEESIIEQVGEMGRIVEYRSRICVSYERAVLLVTNSPVDDDELRGRLRDNLAILAEGANVSTLAIGRSIGIERALQQTNQALIYIQDSEREMQTGTTLALQDMTDQLERAYMSTALTEAQERYLAQIVSSGIENLRKVMLAGEDVLPLLKAVTDELKTETNS